VESTQLLIGLDIGLIAIVLFILDRNIFHYVDLIIQGTFVALQLQIYKRILGIRLWLDRQALFHRGFLGKLWNEYSLWQIRNNPAYKEFFQDRDEV